jgi:dihydroorotase/N-acyl-D-amino-acid deacylase
MKEGAFGLSTGLLYLPGTYSNTDEVIALSQVAARHGGFYTSHLRNEGAGLIESVAEALRIGKEAGIPVVLTHHKVLGQPWWGASVKTLAMVDEARASGQDVQLDQYPYTASHTGIGVLIPAWARAGGDDEFKRRTEDPEMRARILDEITHLILTDRGGGDISNIQFAKVEWDRSLEGRTLRDWSVDLGLEPTPRNGAELVLKAQLAGGANCIYHVMADEDIERIMRHPQTMIASDGRLAKPGEGHPHPRSYGTFPRVLGEYVRDRGVISLESAIHKMTGMPAKRLGLADRGFIREGFRADLVVFDPAAIKDTATFVAPHGYAVGIDAVIVNGKLAVNQGGLTDARAGQVLRGPAAR